MGRYTVLKDPEADATVQRVLDKVCGEVATLLGSNLQAILLVGGYGRGEGGVYKGGETYHLVNDLDLLVFVKNGLRQAKAKFGDSLKQLSHQLLVDGRGLKEIDIELADTRHYRFFVPNTVAYYEISQGHQVIYGDLELDKVMPKLDPTRLPVYEGTNYFRNRGSGLLIAALYFLCNGFDKDERRWNFFIELQKACQAMGDSALLMAGRYHLSYRERLQRLRELDPGQIELSESLYNKVRPLYEWGMIKKILPDFAWTGNKEAIDFWKHVRDIFGDFFLWFESKRLSREFQDWGGYAEFIYQKGIRAPLNLRLLWLLKWLRSSIKKPASLRFKRNSHSISLMIMPILLFYLGRENEVLRLKIWPVVSRLLELDPSESPFSSWKTAVGRFLLRYYPTRTVKDAVSMLTSSED